MIRKSALYHDADISNTAATTQQHNNLLQLCTIEKLPSLLEEEELIWLFSSVILLLIFLRKPDELGFVAIYLHWLALQ